MLVDLGMQKGCAFSVVGVDSNDTKTVVSLSFRHLARVSLLRMFAAACFTSDVRLRCVRGTFVCTQITQF